MTKEYDDENGALKKYLSIFRMVYISDVIRWSGRYDSNIRPSAPKADALPGCATPRRGITTVNFLTIQWEYCQIYHCCKVCEHKLKQHSQEL